MDFYKKSCKALCNKLPDESINNVEELNSFVEKKCREYKSQYKEDAVLENEKKILSPIYEAFNFKSNKLSKNYNYIKFDMTANSSGISDEDLATMRLYIEYLKKMKDALVYLANPLHVKFFSIFLGIGTGKYYRSAAKKFEKKIVQCSEAFEKASTGMFKGLPNGQNYCYLNTALQELYSLKPFRNKVLASNPPETDDYKELRAVNFFFRYLNNKMNKAIFESKRKAMAKDLGYKGNMDSSIEIKQKIEATCRSQMRILKGKLSLESEQVPQQTLDEKERKEIETKWGAELRRLNADVKSVTALMQIILKLYKEKDFKDKVLAIDTAELTLKDIYNDLNRIINLFVCISKNETYSEKSLKILLEWLDRTDNKVQPYHIIKQSILNGINSFNRSKKAHILSVDSTVTIIYVKNSIISSLEDFFDDRRKEKMAYYLPLKNNRFSIHLSDRQTDGNPRSGLSVEETLDLTKLVKDKKLKIFVKNNELKKSNYKFQLISASIGTGIHYYLYEKVGVKWKEKNDSLVEDRTWNEIKSDINEMCETLTYELI